MSDQHDIFISYARADRTRVHVLAQALESCGWRVWWDPNIMPGDTFDRTIAAALAAAKVVVVVWSKTSVDSDWVLNEAGEGRRRGILIPVCIDPVDIPLGFRRVQAADLTRWKGGENDPELTKLCARIADLVGQPPRQPVDKSATSVGRLSQVFGRGWRQHRVVVAAGLMAFAVVALATSAWFGLGSSGPRRPADGIVDCPDCPQLVSIPADHFWMGTTEEEDPEFNPAHGPKHEVTLKKPFLMGRYEITLSQYAEFARDQGLNRQEPGCSTYDYRSGLYRPQKDTGWNNPPIFSQQGDHPVVCVSWFDAKSYVAWLSRKTGKLYRLPTEAEWEYAARGKQDGIWMWKNNPKDACGFANIADVSARKRTEFEWKYHPCDDGYPFTAPVGSLQPNAFGLYDMIGNVWEWVEDCFVKGYDNAPVDGTARPVSADCGERVLRGASWLSRPRESKLVTRGHNDAAARYYSVGFRVVREP